MPLGCFIDYMQRSGATAYDTSTQAAHTLHAVPLAHLLPSSHLERASFLHNIDLLSGGVDLRTVKTPNCSKNSAVKVALSCSIFRVHSTGLLRGTIQVVAATATRLQTLLSALRWRSSPWPPVA